MVAGVPVRPLVVPVGRSRPQGEADARLA